MTTSNKSVAPASGDGSFLRCALDPPNRRGGVPAGAGRRGGYSASMAMANSTFLSSLPLTHSLRS
jgi:hypothetical protein